MTDCPVLIDSTPKNQSCFDFLLHPYRPKMPVLTERLMHVINKIDTGQILTILDIGSMDALESINLAMIFNDAAVYPFEPAKSNYVVCEENISKQQEPVRSRIHLQRIALNNITGLMPFWELDEVVAAKHGRLNRGISSKYEIINPDADYWEHNAQRSVTVVGYRLDDWCKDFNIDRVDSILMSVQGAELDVLQGAGDMLDTVQFVITRVGIKPRYHNHNMKTDIDQYMTARGFIEWIPARRAVNQYELDIIYLNTRYANF